MFSKVLIANRAAIACRVIRSLKKLGVHSVAVYAEVDKHSLHVREADESFSLGEGPATATYLQQQKIIDIALACGAEAIHPGYGFLSENPEFVEACEEAGLVFIGPTAAHMRAFGLKHEARALAQTHKVPLLPGSGLLQDLNKALTVARDIGYPLMLKSTAGGGGIGMQVCRNPAELEKTFASVKRLSANNFSNDGVFLEKFIEHARHIEVQMFGDGQGRAVAFGERDCSAQRRNQKVIEETPAPNIPDNVRVALQEAAIRLLAAVSYRNAGTVEFIYDQSTDEFYFLEVNTRLQVEHGVTEEIFSIDLVEWMLKLAANTLGNIEVLRAGLVQSGHAMQLRIYAENPSRDFQPSAGLLSDVHFPEAAPGLRIDTWIEQGTEVSAFFDPMLAKIICHAENREIAVQKLLEVLAATRLQGIETNCEYLQAVLQTESLRKGEMTTAFLNHFQWQAQTIDVRSAGTLTTLQDYPGRKGYWDVGVPPSGPFDNLAFRIGNAILGNPEDAAGLEITLRGPTLVFNSEREFILCGAPFEASLNDEAIESYKVYRAVANDVLDIKQSSQGGARTYLLVSGGLQANTYLNSKSTFTLGQFGGFSGRALRTGDVLHFENLPLHAAQQFSESAFPSMESTWKVRVIYGPHGAPDFFTDKDIEEFFAAEWEVHYNSSRTGIRLIGPKPDWARESGGEAGMHPSNIHDNAYAVGTIDFTGDMPVILGPDGPSLGGFVCPATVITADFWKLGQLKAGDKVQFIPVSVQEAVEALHEQDALLNTGKPALTAIDKKKPHLPATLLSPIVKKRAASDEYPETVYRLAGDRYLLIEYGPQVLDINLRFRVHALMLKLQSKQSEGIMELTPGIRSLQIHYDPRILELEKLLALLEGCENELGDISNLEVPARVVHLPLSWNDDACRLAIEKYMQSVRKDAPWCPDNIEFIRRINGLENIQAVKDIVFSANYVVMGLGDVYLGAPVATPLDPRHRLVTTKYNPARTWTAENSVGIGGSYLCVYGMEGPGGYQFVGRTLQMWNKNRETEAFRLPWLLRFFDHIRFYEVSAEELQDIREKFPLGEYPLKVENTQFSLKKYNAFLESNADDIKRFTELRDRAFSEELQRWRETGQINFKVEQAAEHSTEEELAENQEQIESHVAGNVWQWQVKPGVSVNAGDLVCILESMKMEIEIHAPCDGVVIKILREAGQQVAAGQALALIERSGKP